MRQVDKNGSHGLVQDNRVGLLHELSNDLSLVVLDDQDLKGDAQHLSSSTFAT